MKNPDIKVKIKHSETKSAWNIIGVKAGTKYKVARIPYLASDSKKATQIQREEALVHAKFIEYCFNNSKTILIK